MFRQLGRLGHMSAQAPETPEHRSGALLDHLARRMRLRSESVLAPLGLRPRHLVALTVLLFLSRDWKPETNETPVKGVGYYWHFVDGIWVFIFSIVYLRTLF